MKGISSIQNFVAISAVHNENMLGHEIYQNVWNALPFLERNFRRHSQNHASKVRVAKILSTLIFFYKRENKYNFLTK